MRFFRFTITAFAAAAGVVCAADIPGRVAFGFNAGGASLANDHERWGASGAYYCYFGELGYEANHWLVGPLLQWGYAYGNADVPAWERAGYTQPPDAVSGEANDLLVGAKIRVPLWELMVRPYAGAGAIWTDYHRLLKSGERALTDYAAAGSGYAALAGVEFFPRPAAGFSFCAEYRYASTEQEWRLLPTAASKSNFDAKFNLAEHLVTLGVKVYTL
jgi:hypothetical protein